MGGGGGVNYQEILIWKWTNPLMALVTLHSLKLFAFSIFAYNSKIINDLFAYNENILNNIFAYSANLYKFMWPSDCIRFYVFLLLFLDQVYSY